jgi:hypothetical protein
MKKQFPASLVILCLPLLLLGCTSSTKIVIELKGLAVKECPPGTEKNKVLVSTNDRANREGKCFLLSGSTEFNGEKSAKNVDVFGRIADVNGTVVLTRRRVGTLAEVKPGKNNFALQFDAAADTKLPFSLTNFQAKGFSEKVQVDQPDFSKK